VKEIQAAAAVLSLKEYENLSLDFPDLNIPETLSAADVILSSEAATPSHILSSSRLLYCTIADRRRELEEMLKTLKARDAKEMWEKKLADFGVWAKKTCEGMKWWIIIIIIITVFFFFDLFIFICFSSSLLLHFSLSLLALMDPSKFGKSLEDGMAYRPQLASEEADIRKELAQKMYEVSSPSFSFSFSIFSLSFSSFLSLSVILISFVLQLKTIYGDINMDTHPPAEKMDIAEEREKDVEAALEQRRKMFQEQMCRFEKDEVAASFNEAFIDYSAWADRVSAFAFFPFLSFLSLSLSLFFDFISFFVRFFDVINLLFSRDRSWKRGTGNF